MKQEEIIIEKEKVAGIIGGMGPEATVDLMQRIIRLTPAADDCDHIRCIVDNNPKIPSRIRAIIEGDGENPGPCMADMGRRLEQWGADFLVIPCNTAHYYYDWVANAVSIPVVNMIDLVCEFIHTHHPEKKNVGILASPSVSITGLYTERLARLGHTDVWPDKAFQDDLLAVIKEIKKGTPLEKIEERYRNVCKNLMDKGAHTAVVACTELGVIQSTLPVHTIDAAEVLACEIVRMAKN